MISTCSNCIVFQQDDKVDLMTDYNVVILIVAWQVKRNEYH